MNNPLKENVHVRPDTKEKAVKFLVNEEDTELVVHTDVSVSTLTLMDATTLLGNVFVTLVGEVCIIDD